MIKNEIKKLPAYNNEKVIREGSTEERHYITGNEGVFAVYVKREDNSSDIYYLHKDHLGSVMEVTDGSGSKVPEGSASFDAWGNRRDPATWQPVDLSVAPLMFDRGFTSHEHYGQFGIIDMNGRCYDPCFEQHYCFLSFLRNFTLPPRKP